MPARRPTNSDSAPGWLQGRGLGPQVKWSLGTDGKLTALAYCRESAELIVADDSPSILKINRQGQITAMARLHEPARVLAWSHDGQWGAAITGDDEVLRFTSSLKLDFHLELPEHALTIALTPYGHHLLVTMANARNIIFNDRKKRITQFETMRPLSFAHFSAEEDVVIGCAEHGLLCCHQFAGMEIWQEKLWNNVGGMRMTGDGQLIYTACFGHGIQTYNGDGNSIGAYVLDGTVSRIDVSYEPQRLIAASIERGLYWLDTDGELLWVTSTPDDIVDLVCDPLGEWAICGFAGQGVYRLDWGGV